MKKLIISMVLLAGCAEQPDNQPYVEPAKQYKYEIQYAQGKYREYDFTDTFTINGCGCISYLDMNDSTMQSTLCGNYKIIPSTY